MAGNKECTEVYSLRIGDGELNFSEHEIADPIVTIEQILELGGARPPDEFDVYEFRRNGTLARLGTDDSADLRGEEIESFLIFRTDRAFRLIINGERYDWGARHISGKALREIANIADDMAIWEERRDEPDHEIADIDLIDLDRKGTEQFYSRQRMWKLKIRQHVYTFEESCITARDALTKAGFDLAKGWDLVLISASGRRPIKVDDKIDLSERGIEKLRVKPSIVNNGERPNIQRHDFALLDHDEAYLDSLKLAWRTVNEGGKRWLLIEEYELPPGLNATTITLALEIPAKYPATQIDMFYCSPHLTFAAGQPIPQTEVKQIIDGLSFQRWSRHRAGESQWQPEYDNVETHLALVEECICREVNA
ncbi:MAG: multiubiquitin domain-containing protein [Parvibaculaceae bacterium]